MCFIVRTPRKVTLMLAYKDKTLENLTLQETYEFEKEMP